MRRSKWLRLLVGALKLAVVALLFTWLIRSGRLDFQALAQLHFNGALAAAAVARVAVCAVFALRWQRLAAARGLDVPASEAARAGFVGRLLDLAAPAGLATDGAKAHLGVTRNAGRVRDVASSVLMDRFVGAAALGLTALAMALLVPGSGFESIRSTLLTAGAALLGLALAAVLATGLLQRLPSEKLKGFTAALHAYRHLPGGIAQSAALAFAGQALAMLSVYFAFAALGEQVGWGQIALGHPLVMLLRTIPLTPAGLGVVDSGAEGVYALLGNASGAEMILLMRGLDLIPAVIGALCLLAPSRLRSPRRTTHEAV